MKLREKWYIVVIKKNGRKFEDTESWEFSGNLKPKEIFYFSNVLNFPELEISEVSI